MVRTVSGLKPVSVLWRRMDAAFTDPLELNRNRISARPAWSRRCARARSRWSTRSAPASSKPARSPPSCRSSPRTAGRRTLLPTIATWWCGQAHERQHVIDNFDTHDGRPRLRRACPSTTSSATVLGEALDPARTGCARSAADRWRRRLCRPGTGPLSTAPVYVDGKLQPRPITLRVYAARTAEGWTIMPGGFARVGSTRDTTAIAMQRGGQAADVWVVSRQARRARVAAAGEGEKLHPQPAGQPAQPRRRQSHLARPLCRALRRHGPHPARLSCPACRTSDPDLPLLTDIARLSRAARHRRRGGHAARPARRPSTAPSTAPARSATASRPMAGWR